MVTSVRPPVQIQDTFQFRPRWWWDPVPDWVLDQLGTTTIREIAVIQMQTQLAVLEAQQKALEQSIGVLRKGK
jgi:hypothetical protein